jgi:hypothetical protein
MPKLAERLTDRHCQTAKPEPGKPQTDHYDGACKGLALRVSARSKTWTFTYQWGGARRRDVLGTYPATSLERARARVRECREAIEDKPPRDPRSLFAKPDTLQSVCEEYLAREAGSLRTGKRRGVTLEKLVYPVLGDRATSDVRRSDIVRMLDSIEDDRGPVAADKALAFIRRVFNWHASRSDDFRSPVVPGMSRTKPRERARSPGAHRR